MRDIIQKISDTDKRITIAPSAQPQAIAKKRFVRLSYLLSLRAISAGGLTIFSVAAILGTKPAQANMKPSASLVEQTAQLEHMLPTNSYLSESTCLTGYHQDFIKGEQDQTAETDFQTQADITASKHPSDPLNLKVSDTVALGITLASSKGAATLTPSGTLTLKDNAPYIPSDRPNTPDVATTELSPVAKSLPAVQDSCKKDTAQPECKDATNHTCTRQLGQRDWTPTHLSTVPIPVFASKNQTQATEFNLESPVLAEAQPVTTAAVDTTLQDNSFSLGPTKTTTDNNNRLAQSPTEDKPTTNQLTNASSPSLSQLALNSIEGNGSKSKGVEDKSTLPLPTNTASLSHTHPTLGSVEGNSAKQLAVEDKTTKTQFIAAPSPTADLSAVHRGPGGASLLGGKLQAQSIEDGRSTSTTPSQTAAQLANPLAPTLLLQGGFITQDETGARARLTGIYPISPNALFGGTVDLTTGRGFSDTPGTGLQLNELYFTGSLPSLPSLRLTVGLMDLTSYFDRNSFAKDSLTHFFNPVFQTNPALAAAGIGSRPGALLNWDITDNFQARAAAFSSSRSLGSFDIDAFAGELAFRAGNAIVRGTFVTDRDAGRDNGFNEIYGIPRSNGDFGIRSSDRENAYGINAEYFFPEIKLGLFGRYGHYEDASLGRGADTYSLGLNFLDLFMPNDRFGFGYGRDLSNNDLRRTTGRKVPDVWELFYDVRVLSNLRAAITLQARDEFSDIVAGFRVRTEFDLLRGLFR